ncbi:hypothetical protein TNCV_4873091 [Trichonephila clavipes]|nr:hypothetical protein TNCV_4873091 [Trichonephila clavipes]
MRMKPGVKITLAFDIYLYDAALKNDGSSRSMYLACNVLYEGDTRNRWRDGPVCPDVDQELWRLGPDSSGVFWRVMRQ